MEKENLDNGIKPDVNESLALAGLFRKVLVQERLPNEDGEYTTNYCLHTKLLTCSGKRKWTIKAGGDTLTVTPDYWLEEVELPTQKQIVTERKNRNYQTFQFDLGAYWIMNVLAGKAVTAKDNVR